MTTRPDPVAKQFVDSALEFHRRRVWNDVIEQAVFLVRVSTKEAPLVGTILGRSRLDYGIAFTRGEGAFRRTLHAIEHDHEFEDLAEAGDLICLSFMAWGAVKDELRRVVHDAGLRPARDRVVPVVFVKRPFAVSRPPGRGDLRTLTRALNGLLAAHDAGELQPLPLDRDDRRVLEVEVDGSTSRPTATTRAVPWPDDSDVWDPPPLVALSPELREFGLIDERWLVALAPVAAELRGDDRALYALYVAEESGTILESGVLTGDDLAPAAEILDVLIRGGGSATPGRPHEIVFDSPRLHGALSPALAATGIEAVLDEDYPPLVALGELVEDGMATVGREELGEPETLLDWKEANRALIGELVEDLFGRSGGPSNRALAGYFGDAERALALLEAFAPYEVSAGFIEWLFADYRATKRSKTSLEKRLAKRSLEPVERTLLEARHNARLSLFRVVSCAPGATLEVEDVFSGERITIHDHAMSGCELDDVVLPLRLLPIKEWNFPVVAGPPLDGLQVAGALTMLRRLEAEFSPDGLRRDAHLVGRLWSWLQDQQGGPRPVMTTTDGDLIEPHTATFTVGDTETLARALARREDVEREEDPGEWTWLREDRTVLGRFSLLDDRLMVEVLSEARLERAREWLERIRGVRFERATRRSLEEADIPLDDRLEPAESEPPPTAEEVEHLRGLVRKQYLEWLDESIPMLDNRTPREACATEEGKRQVQALVRTIPPVQTPSGPVEPPREELLRELGLSAKQK